MEPRSRLNPARAILHPAWVAGLLVLVINDHVLKAAYGNAFTGKLSDFAGLFIAPVLLATLVGARTKTQLFASGLAVGAVFSAINVAPEIALGFDQIVSVIYPFHTTVDPTDLVALIAIPLGFATFAKAMESREQTGKFRTTVGVLCGVAASIGSSPEPEEGPFFRPGFSQVTVFNQTHELQVIRIRPMRRDVQVECDRVFANPTAYLSGSIFDAPTTWFLHSGQQVDLPRGVVCDIVLVESDNAPDVYVTWDRHISFKDWEFDSNTPKDSIAEQTLVLGADYSDTPADEIKPWRDRSVCGGQTQWCTEEQIREAATVPTGVRYSWSTTSDDPQFFPRNAQLDPRMVEPGPGCETPGPERSLTWDDPPFEEFELLGIEEGRDGCHQLTVMGPSDTVRPWWICAPYEALSALTSEDETPRVNVTPSTNIHRTGLVLDAGFIDEEGLFETSKSLYLIRGTELPLEVAFDFEAVVREMCEPQHEVCGNVTIPADIKVTYLPGDNLVRPGESIMFGEVVPREVYLERAEWRAVVAGRCGFVQIPGLYLEAVIISQ